MVVRHLVARDNVVEVDGAAVVVDPTAARHGALRAGRVAALAGAVDPATHLNLDFAAHRLDRCVVVEALTPGASVVFDPVEPGEYRLAAVAPGAFARLGTVDVGARRAAWLAALRARREAAAAGLTTAKGEAPG